MVRTIHEFSAPSHVLRQRSWWSGLGHPNVPPIGRPFLIAVEQAAPDPKIGGRRLSHRNLKSTSLQTAVHHDVRQMLPAKDKLLRHCFVPHHPWVLPYKPLTIDRIISVDEHEVAMGRILYA
jgi:hypothetical protein